MPQKEMHAIEEQLARLRQQIAIINSKYSRPRRSMLSPARCFIEEWSEGEVVRNQFGEHFQTERLFASHRPHGSADVGALAELPKTLLDSLGECQMPAVAPSRWAFLDIETTGLAGGSGIYAFLIGVGRITSEGFRVRQFFMREYAEELSVLAALTTHLEQFDVLITYNGKSYDQRLLEGRYRATRHNPPFPRLAHLDLLHSARRLWQLRLDNCRLIELEQQILGVQREGDLPGELIPFVYFEYLRSREAQRLVPIFHHNALDILTLACLTAIVPAVFGNTDTDSLTRLGVRRGEDLAGVARWLRTAGQRERALGLFKQAVVAGLPDALLFPILWEIAKLEKKLSGPNAAVPVFFELTTCKNPFRISAFEELAKYYEHKEKNYALALEFTNHALTIAASAALQHRRNRLQSRLGKSSHAV